MNQLFTISETSPAAASTVVGGILPGLSEWEFFRLDAALVGATGGTLDVYLQRKIAADRWADWVHFTQLAAGGAAVKWTLVAGHPVFSTAITGSYGIGTDSTPSVALAANTFTGGHPGPAIRAVYVAGASTSAGAIVRIDLMCWKR